MNHITQEQAIELARGAELDWHAGYLLDDERDNRYHALCQAAIDHYIAQQEAREPVAYFDFQEHGFYWAQNVKIGEVPVIRKVAPMPLYSEPDMYKSESKTNISQERVKKSEKSEQVPLRQAQIIAMYDVACDMYVTQDAQAIEFARAVEKYHGIGEKV